MNKYLQDPLIQLLSLVSFVNPSFVVYKRKAWKDLTAIDKAARYRKACLKIKINMKKRLTKQKDYNASKSANLHSHISATK